jgi:trimeric autotransporter adhesin
MNKALAVRWMMLFSLWFSPFMVSSLVFSSLVFAAEGPQTFTLDGRIKQSGSSTPILDSSVQIEVHVMDPSRVCVLYAERQTVNTLVSNGYFNIQVGSITGAGKRVVGVDPGLVMSRVFSNAQAMAGTNVSGQTCPAGTYTPLARDQRYFRIFVTPSGTGLTDTLADVQLDAVPTAMVAENAENANSVGGFGPADLLRVRTTGGHVLTQVNLENIFTTSNHTVLLGLLAGTSPLYNRPAANGTTVLPTIAAPSSPSAGQIWYDAGNVYYHDGATTRTISTGGASSGVAAGNGTAAAPSISFSGDTDTGWYLAGADNLAAATGGVERVRINQNGNLGVGSNSPDARLTLGGAMTAPAWTSSGIGIRQNSVTYTDSSSSGVVGFNYVNAFGVPNLAATSATTYTNASAFSLYPPTPGANVTLTNSTGLTVNASALPGVTNGYGVQVNAPTGATNNYAATFIGGNVGVGTTAPGSRLHVESPSAGMFVDVGRFLAPNLVAGQSSYISVGTAASTNNWGSLNFFNVGAGSSSNRMDFNFFGGSRLMSIRADGNVGINTTAPATRLDVAGSLRVADGGEACAAGTAGGIRYNGGNLQFCNGTAWSTLGVAGAGITALTGDVTASGTGSVAATIANDAVTFAKMQNIATDRILGRDSAGSGDVEELSLGTGLTIAGGALTLSDTTDDDSFATLLGVCGNGFVPHRAGGVWTCLEATDANTVSTLVRRDGAGSFIATQATLNNLRLNNAGSFVNISTPLTANYSLTLPVDDGTPNQILQTDGSGVLTWVTPAPGGTGDFLRDGTIDMTGTFKAVAGTAALPGITFTGDTNNGIYAPAADNVAVTTAGTERLRVTDTGNVGIGTTAPGPAALAVTRNTTLAAPPSDNASAETTLHLVSADNKMNFLTMDSFGDSSWRYPILNFRRSRGTASAPTNPTASTSFVELRGSGWVDTAYTGGANMFMTASENWSSSAQGASIWFEVKPKGSVTGVQPLYIGDHLSRTSIVTLGTSTRNAASWTTGGSQLNIVGGTTTDTTGSGTIANRVSTAVSQPTFASTNAVTLTNAANFYIAGAPIAGANTTITNSHSLHIASGNSYFGGNVGIGATDPATRLDVAGTLRVADGGEACAAGTAGGIRYNGGNLQFCNGTAWSTLGVAGAGITALTGDVTASGTGSVAATIANDAVTFAKMQNIATQRLIGRSTAAAGDAEELSVGTGLTITGGALNLTDTTDDDSFATLLGVCGNGFVPHRVAGAWTCLEATDANTFSTLVRRDGAGSFTATQATLNALRLNNAGSFVNISTPATASYSLTLPIDDGTANQVLQTDGSGVLTWVTPASGSGDFLASGTVPMTGAFRAIPGTAALPGVTFVGDTNNGIYAPAADNVAVTTAGTERMRVDSAGNVGIGTTAPGATLDVHGYTRATQMSAGISVPLTVYNNHPATAVDRGVAIELLGPSGASYGLIAAADATGGNVDSYLSFSTRGSSIVTEKVRINSAGNVGIGTTAPATRLEVAGTLRVADGGEACAAGTAGGIRYNGGNLQFCNGTAWSTLGVAGAGITALTGDVTASGTGSVAATIANDAVTFAKMQNIATQRLIGRSTAAAGDAEELSVGTGLTITGGALNLTDTTDDDSFATLLGVCGNGFVPHRVGGAWTCLEATDANTLSTLVRRDGAGSFTATQATLNNLRLNNAGSFVNISTPLTANYNLTLPIDDGTPNQVLQTDGSGVLTWVTPAAGGAGDFLANGTVPMTGAFRATDGTAAAPSITFNSDQDTGIYRSAADRVAIAAGGAQSFYFVGSSSAYISNGGLRAASGNAATPSLSFENDTNTGLLNPAADNVAVTTAGTERMRVDASGNVGIGTTNPNSLLYVSGGATGNAKVTIEADTDNNSLSEGSFVEFIQDTATVRHQIGAATAPGVGPGYVMTGAIDDALVLNADTTTSTGTLQFATEYATRMTINSSGNVGIGTTAPTVRTHVDGTLRIGDGGELCAAAGAGSLKWNGTAIQFCDGTSWASLGGGGGGDFLADGSVPMTGAFRSIAGTAAAPGVTFVGDTNNGIYAPAADTVAVTTAGAERLRVGSTGNVGIGTTAPSNLLEIRSDVASDVGLIKLSNRSPAAYGTGSNIQFHGESDIKMAEMSVGWAMNNQHSGFEIRTRRNGNLYNAIKIEPWGAANVPEVHIGNYNVGAPALGGRLTVNSETPGGNSVIAGLTLSNFDSDSGSSNGIGNRLVFQTETSVQATNAETGYIESVLDDANDTSKDGSLRFGTLGPNAGAISILATEKMRIDSSGNVGIGTTLPTVRTHISGTLRIGDGGELCAAAGAGSLKWNGTAIQFCDGTSWASLGGGGSGLPAADGTAAAPSISFASDTDTGIYRSTTNQLSVTTGGVERARFNTNGLAVLSDVTSVGYMLSEAGFYSDFDGSAGGPAYSFFLDPNTGLFRPAAETLALSTNGTERLRVGATGNVGIGTTAPTTGTRLDIAGTTAADSSIIIPRATTATRPTVGVNGMMRYNTTTSKFEAYEAGAWVDMIGGGGGITALTGDVTASGTGSVAATIANTAVTFAKMQNITSQRLLGRSTAGSGIVQELSLGTGLNLSAGVVSATGLFADGTAALPSIGFASDTNTGIYRAGADTIGFSGGGSSLATLASGGFSVNTSITTVSSVTADRTFVGMGSATMATHSFAGDNNTGLFSPAADTVAVTTAGSERLRVTAAGDVGIGMTPSASYKLDVSGDARVTTLTYSSDERLKRDIQSLEDPLTKILSIDGVSYLWRTDQYPDRNFSKNKQVGLIAQDVEKVYPELVTKDDKGFLGVNYSGLVAPVIAAFKQFVQEVRETFATQNKEIEQLKSENAALKKYLCEQDPNAPFCN